MSEFDVTPEFLYGLACHEAGHAVALFLAAQQFGIPGRDILMGIRVDNGGDGYLIDFNGGLQVNCRGLVTCSDIWLDMIKRNDPFTIDDKKHLAHLLEIHAITIFAGPYAEAISQGLEISRLKAEKISKKISSLNLPYSVFFRRSVTSIQSDARELVLLYWPAIEAIAQRLVVKGELSGEEAYEIFVATPVKLAA